MWRALAKRLAAIVHRLTPDGHLDEHLNHPTIEAVLIAARDALSAYGDEVPEGAFAYELPAVSGRVVVRTLRLGENRRRVHIAMGHFAELMKAAGNHCQLVAFEGAGHDFFNGSFFRKKSDDRAYEQTLGRTIEFLTEIGMLGEPLPDTD